jgi:hypothetical protein
MEMVDGHPALVQIAFYHLSRGEMTLEHLLKTSATNVGIYTHHLQRHWLHLKEYPELLTALHPVLPGIERVDLEPIFAHKLTSLGLVKQLESNIVSSCELYRQFFLNHQNYAL